MSIKTLAAAAASIIAASAWAGPQADQKCGAGTCGKKETSTKDTGCSKKDKEASCSKKDADGNKKTDKEASCSKK